jgi:hypothetical protein
VTIAVPAIAAGSGISANKPRVGNTPPGPNAMMPTPTNQPEQAQHHQ